MVIYTTGYGGPRTSKPRDPKYKAFVEMVDRGNLIVIDVRLNPRSPAPCWRKHNLMKDLGTDRYCSVPDLGNDNYKSDKDIKIRDWQAGLATMMQAAARTKRIPLLLCGCEDAEYCHRTVEANALRGMGHQVTEIDLWDTAFLPAPEGDAIP